jgi:hypothetical protein
MMTGWAQQVARDPPPLTDGQGDVFEHAQSAEQRGDLKGGRDRG